MTESSPDVKSLGQIHETPPVGHYANPFLDLGGHRRHHTDVISSGIPGEMMRSRADTHDGASSTQSSVLPHVSGQPGPSTNPFLSRSQKQSRLPPDASDTSPEAPRLPPRKCCVTGRRRPSLPPRRPTSNHDQTSSVSQLWSDNSEPNPPTSRLVPSTLMQQSLQAAGHEHGLKEKNAVSIHVIGRSGNTSTYSDNLRLASRLETSSAESQANPSRHHRSHSIGPLPHRTSALVARVSQAVKEVDEFRPQPPPQRRNSVRASSKLVCAAQPYMTAEPKTKLWNCGDILSSETRHKRYAMIILNQPITRKDAFLRAWNASQSSRAYPR